MIRIIFWTINRSECSFSRWQRPSHNEAARLGTLHRVRILLAGMSNMLSNIVTAALARAPDIVVAGHVADTDNLASQICFTGADAVIVQTSRPSAAATFLPLLHTFSTLKVVA